LEEWELLCLLEDFEEECLDDDEDLLDFSGGTSRMFKTLPVVGSVVED
jgi:hypothetical protein